MKGYLRVGTITKPQGIRGEVKVQPATDDPARFLELQEAYLDERGERPVRVASARVNGAEVYLAIEGIADRNAAEGLRELPLYVDRAHAIPLPEGRYFIQDLVGLAVEDENGEPFGALEEVFQAGGNDVYSVKGKRNFLFPALKRVIARVDLENGKMVLRGDALLQVAVYDDED